MVNWKNVVSELKRKSVTVPGLRLNGPTTATQSLKRKSIHILKCIMLLEKISFLIWKINDKIIIQFPDMVE